jgi:hypothetical protein
VIFEVTLDQVQMVSIGGKHSPATTFQIPTTEQRKN